MTPPAFRVHPVTDGYYIGSYQKEERIENP